MHLLNLLKKTNLILLISLFLFCGDPINPFENIDKTNIAVTIDSAYCPVGEAVAVRIVASNLVFIDSIRISYDEGDTVAGNDTLLVFSSKQQNDTTLIVEHIFTTLGQKNIIVKAWIQGNDTMLLRTVSVHIGTRPTLASDTLITSGEPVVGESYCLQVKAAGTAPLSYSWYKNDTVVSGVTGDTLHFDTLLMIHSGTYYCAVSNLWGSVSTEAKELTVALDTAKAITAFNFTSPAATGVINETAKTIALTVPYGTSVTALVPTITHTGASISPASGVAQNFTNPATYTVTAIDASRQEYVVTVTVAANSAKAITAFNFTTPAVTGVINEAAKTIALTVPYGSSVTTLVPTITHTGASISPASGVAQNFTNPVTYTVTAIDASTQEYVITVTVAANSAKAITAFNFTTPAVTGVINETAKTIALTVPYGTSVTALVPTITHTGASISPASGVTQNFTNPVTYTVTAADASTQAYVVTVTVLANPAKAITGFSFPSVPIAGTINESAKTIAVTVPYGTTVTYLIPEITHTGASISPASGVAQNFTNPVTYTVTAADASTQAYVVTVTVTAPSTNANLSALTVSTGTLSPAFSPAITNYTVSVANEVTSITVTGVKADQNATISANNGVAQNLNVGDNTITLTITAQDGMTMKSYVVTVTRSPKPVTFFDVRVNGTPWTVSTTVCTLSFSDNLPSFTSTNISVTGATEWNLDGSGTTWRLSISNITVTNGQSITVAVSNPAGFIITPGSRSVAVNVRTTYSINYFGNGNTGGSVPSVQTKVHGEPITLAQQGNLVRTGYNFAGWNTQENGEGTDYAAGKQYDVNAGLTLYAKWVRWLVKPDTLIDPDGNIYTTVTIGTQVWTVQNLRVTKYNDGTAIPHVSVDAAWEALTTPGYCYFNNATHVDTIKKWGALYNWYALAPTNPKQIAPAGWRVPTDADWTNIENYLIANGYNWDGTTSGNKIAKSMAAKTDWQTYETEGTPGHNPSANNNSGVSALPSGYRSFDGRFFSQNQTSRLWSATESNATNAWYRTLDNGREYLWRDGYGKSCGFSLRLVRDVY